MGAKAPQRAPNRDTKGILDKLVAKPKYSPPPPPKRKD